MEFTSNRWTVQMVNEPTYTFGSADNVRKYGREYSLGSPHYHNSSVHGITTTAASAVVGAGGGASGIHNHSLVIVDDNCFVAVGDQICCMRLPELTLVWHLTVDPATCFGVFHSVKHQALFSHGELEIARLSLHGALIWATSGKDIFSEGFSLFDDHIEAVDFNGEIYRIDIESGRNEVMPNQASEGIPRKLGNPQG